MLKKLKDFLFSNTDTLESQNDDGKEALKEKVIAALKTVFDPEIPINIYDLGLIYNVIINKGNHVKIEMTLTSPGCPVAATFPQTVANAIKENTTADDVSVELVWEPPWSKDRMSEAARLQLNLFD